MHKLLQVCNIGTLGLAVHIRYDYVFGNSDIETLLSKFRIADHTFTRALNIFSNVIVTFSSTTIAVIIFASMSIVSTKWKRILLFIVSSDTNLMDVNDLNKNNFWIRETKNFTKLSKKWWTLTLINNNKKRLMKYYNSCVYQKDFKVKVINLYNILYCHEKNVSFQCAWCVWISFIWNEFSAVQSYQQISKNIHKNYDIIIGFC